MKRHGTPRIGEHKPIHGGQSPGDPAERSPHSVMDRHSCPREVTVTSEDVERAQTEPMPPQATPLLTNMGLVASERFRPISVSIRRINHLGPRAILNYGARYRFWGGFGVLYMALRHPNFAGYWGVGNSQKIIFASWNFFGLVEIPRIWTVSWRCTGACEVLRVLVRSKSPPETPLVDMQPLQVSG